MRRDPRKLGPLGLGRTPVGDARSRRNDALSSTNRLSAPRVEKVVLGKLSTTDQKLAALEATVNKIIANLQSVRAMD